MASKWIVLVFSMLWCLSAASRLTGETETDVDEGHGHEWDIFDINKEQDWDLLKGDIVIDETDSRNTILGEQYLWPQTVPYYLKDSLDINAKGVILKAFEQYRLKTCINFVPWKGDNNYISVFKGTGCYYSVDNRQVGKQRLSIGRNCDRLATVEHELLHALGFWHEQSGADRDDYVNIMWDRIEEGRDHNFLIHGESVSSALNVPSDYGSVMLYSKTAFNIGSEPSIITKIPSFMDVISQRMEFDMLKLNRLYNCTTSSTFLDSCSFEKENICGMIQGPVGKAQWEHRHSVAGGPNTDYTNMGQCDGKGYFMHFSTVKGNHGDQANLESRYMSVYINGRSSPGSMAIYFHLTSGPKDDSLTWPCPWHQTTMALMDQNPDIRQRMSNHHMITTDPNKLSSDGNDFYWDNPLKVGSLVNGSDGNQFYRGPGTGTSSYLTHCRLKSWNFKGDNAIFLLGLEDVSALLETQPLPHSAVHQSEKSAEVSPSRETNTSTVVMAVSMSLAAVMFVVTMVSAVYTRRVRRPESDVIVVDNI
ncbi:meprin A subunit beta-like [Oncorhynchus masou masou]|uniref:meprin A subunit beta-like n=1 Tax=Oncorhynchus masou masou TaxID=90313 RepID=UPI003184622F